MADPAPCKRRASDASLSASERSGKASKTGPRRNVQQIKDDLSGTAFLEASAAAVSNAKYFTTLRDSIDSILTHPYFETILEDSPLGIGNSGHKNVFKQEDFDTAMADAGLYEGACNFWWQSFKPSQARVVGQSVLTLTE
jgi:hypothetical protein